MEKIKRCECCIYYHSNDCRKHAPVRIISSEKNDDGLFPRVSYLDWCGDYEVSELVIASRELEIENERKEI